MDGYNVLCDKDNVVLYKKNVRDNLDDNIETYRFTFDCIEDKSQTNIFDIVNNNQFFDLIYNINSNIITEFKNLENNINFIKIKEISLDEDDIEDTLCIYLCLKETYNEKNSNDISINFENIEYKLNIVDYKQIFFNYFNVNITRKNDKLFIVADLKIDVDTLNFSIIDNDSIMIVLKVLFKNLREYLSL